MPFNTDINVVGHSPAEIYQPTRNTATLVAQNIVNPNPSGTAAILYEAPLPVTDQNFSLDFPFGPEVMPDSYQLAVRCIGPSGDTLRYLLIEPTAGAILFPAYDGQTLYPTAVLEVWSVTGQPLAEIDEDIVITLSPFTRPATANMINSYGLPVVTNTNL